MSNPIDESLALLEKARQRYVFTTYLVISALISAGYIAYLLSFVALVGQQFESAASDGSWKIPTSIFAVLAGSMLLEAFLEIPAGVISDRRGHHLAVRAGAVFLLLQLLTYTAIAVFMGESQLESNTTFLILLSIGEIFLAWGTALQSGSLNSWFVVSVRRAGYVGSLTKFMARRRLITNLTWLVIGVLVVALRDLSLWIPFAVGTVACALCTALSSLWLSSDQEDEEQEIGLLSCLSETLAACVHSLLCLISFMLARDIFRQFMESLGCILRSRRLLMILIVHLIFWTLGLTIAYFWQLPIKVAAPEAQETALLSLAWLALILFRVAGSEYAARIPSSDQDDRRNRAFLGAQVIIGLPMFVLFMLRDETGVGATLVLALALAVSRFGQELGKPIVMAWIHEEINAESERHRATIESINEGVSGLGLSLVLLIVLSKPWLETKNLIPLGIDPVTFCLGFLGVVVLIANIPTVLVGALESNDRVEDSS